LEIENDSVDKTPQSNVSIIELPILIVVSSAIVYGLVNEGLIFDYALFGPIFLFSLGVCLQIILVEIKGPYSMLIDVKISKKLHIELSKSEIHSRAIVNKLFFILFLLNLFSAIWVMGRLTEDLPLLDTPSWFAIFLLSSSIFLGLFISRIIVWVKKPNSDSASIQGFATLDSKSVIAENKIFARWLVSSDPNIPTSKHHMKSLGIQRDLFVDYINSEVKIEDLRRLLSGIGHEGSQNIDNFNELLLDFITNAKTDWFFSIDNYVRKTNDKYVEAFNSLLLCPVLISIIRKTIHDSSVRNIEISNLFDYLAVYLNRLNYVEMVAKTSSDSILELNSHPEDIEFIRELSKFSVINEMNMWDPWWLLDMRMKLVIVRNANLFNLTEPISSAKYCGNLFESIAVCISKINSQSESSLMLKDIENLIKEQLRSRAEENEMDEISEMNLLTQFINSSPKIKSAYFHLILLAWNLFRSMKSKSENISPSESDLQPNEIDRKPINKLNESKDITSSEHPDKHKLGQMKKTEIQDLLKKSGLSHSGNKSDLINRLYEHWWVGRYGDH